MNKKRSFIIDFGCCLPFGHNLHFVNLYREREESRGQDAKAIVCRRVGSFKGIDKKITYSLLPVLYPSLIIDTVQNKLIRFYLTLQKQLLSFPLGKTNLLSIKAYFSVRKVFKKYRMGKGDTIIFPSVEYYGVKAFLKKLGKVKEEERPHVHLRFIGVLEFSNSYFRNSLSELVDLMNKNHQTITVSAEVPIYARYLNVVLPKINVIAEPYPLEDKIISVKKEKNRNADQPFTILLPGTNRTDKGYFDIYNLAKELLFEFPEARLIVQDMKKWDKSFNKKYQLKLKNLANVQLVDAILPRKEIEAFYDQANLILLPYDPNVYYFRGSAIHYEAIMNRIPVLVRKGVGFIEEVNQWSSGWVYETKQELFSRIKEIKSMDSQSIDEKMDAAMNNFKKNSDEAYNFNLS